MNYVCQKVEELNILTLNYWLLFHLHFIRYLYTTSPEIRRIH